MTRVLGGFVLLTVLMTSCHFGRRTPPEVDVGITNQTPHVLRNAYVAFGEHKCRFGVLGSGASATYMYYPFPITSDAEVHWEADASSRSHRIDLTNVYNKGQSGKLIFYVTDTGVSAEFRVSSPE